MKLINLKTSKKCTNLLLASLIMTGLFNFAQAADNPKPSSWQNIVIKSTETYGNNQTKPLRGAKVTIDLEDRSKSSDFKTRFPQTKTSGPRGVTFTRMPPSSIVGKYIVTVDPKPNDKNNAFTCKEKEKVFIHNTNKAKKQFTFRCLKSKKVTKTSSTNKSKSHQGSASNSPKEKMCHKVRVQKQEGRRSSVNTTACQQSDGSWKIAPYQY